MTQVDDPNSFHHNMLSLHQFSDILSDNITIALQNCVAAKRTNALVRRMVDIPAL